MIAPERDEMATDPARTVPALVVENFYDQTRELQNLCLATFRIDGGASIWQYVRGDRGASYLRAAASVVFDAESLARFMAHLRFWSIRTYGVGNVSAPDIVVSFDGHAETRHPNEPAGLWEYNLDLSSLDESERSIRRRSSFLGHGVVEHVDVADRYNQLVLIDTRARSEIQRTAAGPDQASAPALTLRGYLAAGATPRERTFVDGHLIRPVVYPAFERAEDTLFAEFIDSDIDVSGVIVIRMEIATDGGVATLQLLSDRLDARTLRDHDRALERVRAHLLRMRFPAEHGTSELTYAFSFVNPASRTTADPQARE
jgi:hypothetical protein